MPVISYMRPLALVMWLTWDVLLILLIRGKLPVYIWVLKLET